MFLVWIVPVLRRIVLIIDRAGGFEAAQGASGPIDLFDGSGAYLGTLPPEAPLPLAFLPDGRVLVKEVDEQTEVERVAVGSLVVSEAGGG